uniref:uncharacterized protein LOC117162670 n=1 Tax=Bombus vancouverensis nearcticus TaxID=2705178 RepID=UPI001439EEA4|nr:uncharacterized protein LOC117162670 [Bombus vancouverensis nearcticus]
MSISHLYVYKEIHNKTELLPNTSLPCNANVNNNQVRLFVFRRILEDLEAQYHWDENHDIENDTCKLNNFPDLFVISCYAKNRLSYAYKGNIKYRKTLFHCR